MPYLQETEILSQKFRQTIEGIYISEVMNQKRILETMIFIRTLRKLQYNEDSRNSLQDVPLLDLHKSYDQEILRLNLYIV